MDKKFVAIATMCASALVFSSRCLEGGKGGKKENRIAVIETNMGIIKFELFEKSAMARTSDPNSATSQFYICDGPQHSLDGKYAAFGKVIEGMDVVRAIAEVETGVRYGYQDWALQDGIMNRVYIE